MESFIAGTGRKVPIRINNNIPRLNNNRFNKISRISLLIFTVLFLLNYLKFRSRFFATCDFVVRFFKAQIDARALFNKLFKHQFFMIMLSHNDSIIAII